MENLEDFENADDCAHTNRIELHNRAPSYEVRCITHSVRDNDPLNNTAQNKFADKKKMASSAPPVGGTLFHFRYFEKEKKYISNNISLLLLVVYLLALGRPTFLFCHGAV